MLKLHPLPINQCLWVPANVSLCLWCLIGWCIRNSLCLYYWVLGSLLKLGRVLLSLWWSIVQARLRGAGCPGMGPGRHWRGPRGSPKAIFRGQRHNLRPRGARGGDTRDEKENVDTRDHEARGHQHCQRHCRVEGPCWTAQGQATRQRAAEAQRRWRWRGAHCAALAWPRRWRRWPQVQKPPAAVEAHGALAWCCCSSVARQQTGLCGQSRQPPPRGQACGRAAHGASHCVAATRSSQRQACQALETEDMATVQAFRQLENTIER